MESLSEPTSIEDLAQKLHWALTNLEATRELCQQDDSALPVQIISTNLLTHVTTAVLSILSDMHKQRTGHAIHLRDQPLEASS